MSSEELLSLHRYFIWADGHRARFFDLAPPIASETDPERRFDLRFRAIEALSYWYGALYVVVEGWRELGLADHEIDGHLANATNVELLRRYRNGTFHFQRRYFDHRFIDLAKAGTDVVAWVQALHAAFDRYFLERRTDRGKPGAD